MKPSQGVTENTSVAAQGWAQHKGSEEASGVMDCVHAASRVYTMTELIK